MEELEWEVKELMEELLGKRFLVKKEKSTEEKVEEIDKYINALLLEEDDKQGQFN